MCSHIQDAIGINLKGDLNLRDAAGCRWDACQVKLTQLVVVLGHGTLTLIYLQ